MIKKVLTVGNLELKKKAHKVQPYQDVTGLVRDLRDTMEAYGGAGLAANQIGVLQRVIIANNVVYVNPEIVKVSEDWVIGTEACLSMPGYRADVWRHASVRVKALTEKGHPFKVTLHDWEAIVLQHEVAHLDGRLMIDEKHENFRKAEQPQENVWGPIYE